MGMDVTTTENATMTTEKTTIGGKRPELPPGWAMEPHGFVSPGVTGWVLFRHGEVAAQAMAREDAVASAWRQVRPIGDREWVEYANALEAEVARLHKRAEPTYAPEIMAAIDSVRARTGQRQGYIRALYELVGDWQWFLETSLVTYTTKTGGKRAAPMRVWGIGDSITEAADDLVRRIQSTVENGAAITSGGRIEVWK